MTDTLFDATLVVARSLNRVRTGIATGGSTTTVVDSNFRTESDDYWNGGTVWITEDVGGAGAAPEGEFSRVTDFANATGTITCSPAITAVGAGDKYAVADAHIPLDVLIEAVNEVLTGLQIELEDWTSLDTVAGQTVFSLPSTIPGQNLKEVHIQTKVGDADDFRWRRVYNWEIDYQVAGTEDKIILPRDLTAERDLRLVYVSTHGALYDDGDKIDESIHLNRIRYAAAMNVLEWQMADRSGDKYVERQYEKLAAKAAMAERNYPIRKRKKTGRIMRFGASASEDRFKAIPSP